MAPSTQSSFSEVSERLAQHHELEMWRAAQTVRAHVAPEGLAAMLDCLGLTDAARPPGRQ